MSPLLFYGFTREFILSRYEYDPLTGIVKSRVATGRHGCHKAGRTVGYKEPNGYVRVNIDGTMVRLHQLVWFMQTGETPEQIDHEDLDKSNHKWRNLRAATRHQNKGNTEKLSNNTSGFKGVHFDRLTGKWRACIRSSPNKTAKLGRYDSLFFAAAVYNYEAVKTFGPFARLNDIPGVGKLCVELDSIGLYL